MINIIQLWRETRATAIIETAILLPTLMFVGLGGLEITNLAIASMRASQITSQLADNASRISAEANLPLPVIREGDVNELLAAALVQGQKWQLEQKGRIILSSLETDPVTGVQWIHWQRCAGQKMAASAFGVQGTKGGSFTGMGKAGERVTAPPGAAVMFVELIYDYQPMILSSLVGNKTLRYNASFIVRDDRNLDGITNPAPASPIATCQ